jgi:hypothetical protein
MVTIFVLIAVDNKAPGAIAEYGLPMRSVVWGLIVANLIVMFNTIEWDAESIWDIADE